MKISVLVLFVSTATFAQVGINADENTIEKDAVLHINSAANTKQGIVIPKVALTGKKEIIKPNATTNTTSLLVWNDGTGGLTPAGFYYWHNDEWNLLNTSSSSTSQEGTFTRNFRKDNRATVKVDKLQDGATPTKDYFVYMDSVQDLILPPPIPDNIECYVFTLLTQPQI